MRYSVDLKIYIYRERFLGMNNSEYILTDEIISFNTICANSQHVVGLWKLILLFDMEMKMHSIKIIFWNKNLTFNWQFPLWWNIMKSEPVCIMALCQKGNIYYLTKIQWQVNE